MATESASTGRIVVLVNVEVLPERLDEFVEVMKKDADGSREEPGCVRFDVLRDPEEENKFCFYEVYENEEAVEFHKAQPHYALWSEFKGCVNERAS
eukprot:scaffold890_cov269-Pinguiococcus_pyrenoidosus.AAC.16